MQDRVPLYPGRVTLTPVSGQANTYDLTRADQPTQEGTPLNKASLLKDTTAALFGKSNTAVPDDILSLLSKSALAQVSAKYTKHIGTNADRPVGSTVALNVGGKSYEFIVVQQGKPSSLYDDSCNGTWLLMKDIYENRQWHSSDMNKLENSAIHSYLNSTFLNLFDSNIRDAIKQVKLPYRKDGGSGGQDQSGANGLLCKIFLLSGYEVGWTTSDNSNFPVDGAKLSYFESGTGASAINKRIAKLNGSAARWWLRSPFTNSSDRVWHVNSNGNGYSLASSSYGIRPCIIMPSDSEYIYYTDSSGNVYTEQEYETKLTDVLGNLISIPADQIKDGVKIATGSYTGTGTYGASNPNSLTFAFEPKLVFITGNSGSDRGIFILGQGRGELSSSYVTFYILSSGKNMSWYSNSGSAQSQLNMNNQTYYYVAIG